jgi:hypothetical protein
LGKFIRRWVPIFYRPDNNWEEWGHPKAYWSSSQTLRRKTFRSSFQEMNPDSLTSLIPTRCSLPLLLKWLQRVWSSISCRRAMITLFQRQ